MSSIIENYKSAAKQLQMVVSQTPQRINDLNKIIQRCDWEEQDFLHLAELENFNASQGYDISNQIKKIRIKKRNAKDELEALIEFRKVANNNSKLEAHATLLSKVITSEAEKRSKHKYNVRVRTELAKRFERIHGIEGKLE